MRDLAPSPRAFAPLFAMEWRELLASRAWWLLLALAGPLVGQAFIAAVSSYAEMSGAGGGPAALAQGLSPLDGIVAPTLAAYDVMATFLLPFVAIRLLAGERESGASKLVAQAPASTATRLLAKLAALLLGWGVAWLPALAALLLWRGYGGHLAAPETTSVVLGHWLHALLVLAVALAAAAIGTPATAAILALGFTVGTWALEFVGTVHGAPWDRLAQLTPGAALHAFERGDVRLGALVAMLAGALAALLVAGAWTSPFLAPRRRLVGSITVLLAAGGALTAATTLHRAWDVSEDRRSSLPRADEARLRSLQEPLRVTVNLAPEDPRRADLETQVLAKLRRVVPRLDVRSVAAAGTGMFAGSDPHYGEVWYEVGARRAMQRSTIEPVVLETIYDVAGLQPPPANAAEPAYTGYPLAAAPRGAAVLFYLVAPATVGAAYLITHRRRRTP